MPLCLTKCYLESVDDPKQKIYLPHKRKVPIGPIHPPTNCPQADAHVFAEADLEEMKVNIENTGRGNTRCNRTQLKLIEKKTLKHGDRVSLQDGKQVYQVKFYPMKPLKLRNLKGEAKKFLPKEKSPEPCGVKKRLKGEWEHVKEELLVYTPPKMKSSCQIAGFGLIGTLVKVNDKPSKRSEWKLAFNNTSEKLKRLQQKGYKIVVFSNNVLTQRLHLNIFKRKISMLIRRIGVPIQVFMSLGDGMVRKPVTGMWYALGKRNDNKPPNTSKSFYVGDLAGRRSGWAKGKPCDASNEDRLFAVNVGVKFFTPEEYFLDTPIAPYRFPKYNPRENCSYDFKSLISKTQEMVVMVGPPDSGKSWFCKHHLVPAGYLHVTINYVVEMLRSRKVLKDFLKQGKNVVVDGMNPSCESRRVFVKIAKKCCVGIRCFEMKVSGPQLRHNQRFRVLSQLKDGLKEDEKILVFHTFYQKPEVKEGFSEVVQVPFAPNFADPEMNALYRMFLLPQ